MAQISERLTELNSIAYFAFSNRDALAYLRILGPAEFGNVVVITGVDRNGKLRHDAVDKGDILILQRDICKDYLAFTKILRTARVIKKPIVFDLDDMLFLLPEEHPDRKSGYYTDALLPMLQAVTEADLVTVSTEYLRAQLLPFNPNVKVIPNYLNDRLWDFQVVERNGNSGGCVTIGYMGSKSHQPDLEMIVPIVHQLIERYPNRLRFHFFGISPPEAIKHLANVTWFSEIFTAYPDFADYFQTQSADLFLAPLSDTPFNACKSPIKFLEYGALGIPGVYSNVKPYSDIVHDGEDGLLATSMDEWVTKVTRLIDYPDLRYRIAKTAQENIQKSWLLSKNFSNQMDIYRQMLGEDRATIPPSPMLEVFKGLSAQYYEELLRKKQTLNDSYRVNAELKKEMVGYLTSSSWKIMRPFRNLARRLRRDSNAS